MVQKYRGYAQKILGYHGEKYALFRNGKRVGESSLAGGDDKVHQAELRRSGYRIKKGYITVGQLAKHK